MKILAIVWDLAKSLQLFFLASIFLIVSCNPVLPIGSGSNSNNGSSVTFALPTSEPTAKPTPANTRVIGVDSLTPSPVPSITPLPEEIKGLVVEVIDGDTIAVVLNGDPTNKAYQVRYIGIDAPPNSPSDPWGVVAYEANKRLVSFSVVRLVKDQKDFDEEGHLLRYVYIDNQLTSILLAEQGLAQASPTGDDNTQFEREIEEASGRAEEGALGIWSGSPPTATPTRTRSGSNKEETTEPANTEEAEIEGTTEAVGTPAESEDADGEEENTPTAEPPTETTPEAIVEPTDEATAEPDTDN